MTVYTLVGKSNYSIQDASCKTSFMEYACALLDQPTVTALCAYL
jgi:hypothetical protein